MRTRAVVPSLAAGALAGLWLRALAAANGPADYPRALVDGALDLIRVGLFGQPASASNAQILVLILLIGGFVGLVDRSGGTRAVAERIAARVRTPAQAQLAAWLGGMVIFFSDFGNTLILGPVFRPVFDRLGVPREKLAWVIDATAAPVCVLVPFIAWGVYVIGLLESSTAGLAGPDAAAMVAAAGPLWDASAGQLDGFSTFLAAVPFQLYPWMALTLVPLVALSGRDLGSMRRAAGVVWDGDATQTPPPGAALAAASAFGAMALALALTLAWALFTEGKLTGGAIRVALATAYLAATGTALLLLARTGAMSLAHGRDAVRDGMGRTIPLAVLLICAWTLAAVCKQLGTGAWLAGALAGGVSPELLPVAVFGVAAAMSLSTGTSWGTFAIVVPLCMPLAAELGAGLPVTLGAALAGGVLGDHASPISDTTVLASVGAGVEHADHVATQLPYAALAGAAAAVGLLTAGATGSAALALGAGAVTLVAGLAALGRRADPQAE